MPSLKELYKRLDDVRIDADSINVNTDTVESLLSTVQADIALIKNDMANGVLVNGALDYVGAIRDGEGQTFGLDRSFPVEVMSPVSVVSISTTGATPTTFSSVTYATISAANSSRKGLTIFNEGAGLLYVTLGTSTTTATSYTTRLSAGDYYEVPFEYTGLVGGIFGTSGTARVTEVT